MILVAIQPEFVRMLRAVPGTQEGLRKCLLCLISSVFAGVELLLELANALFFPAGKLRPNFRSGGLHSGGERPHLAEDCGDRGPLGCHLVVPVPRPAEGSRTPQKASLSWPSLSSRAGQDSFTDPY